MSGAGSYRQHAAAWAALVTLALGSFALASLPLGPWGLLLALCIGAAKAAIITLVFMNLVRARASVRLSLALSVVWIALLVAGLAGDVATRDADEPRPPLDCPPAECSP